MTSDKNRTVKVHAERAISYVPPEVVNYGDAGSITTTINGSVNNDGGATPPNVYVS